MKNSKLDAHKHQWYAYYSEKRIVHQWFQVKLLENLPVQRIMEIGPAYGVPTALLANAGYEVTTLDFMKRNLLELPHILLLIYGKLPLRYIQIRIVFYVVKYLNIFLLKNHVTYCLIFIKVKFHT